MKSFFASVIVAVLAAPSLILEVSAAKGVLRDLTHTTEESTAGVLEEIISRIKTLEETNVVFEKKIGMLEKDNVELRRLIGDQPFTCTDDQCTADSKYFVFPKGVLVGARNYHCDYGEAVLSVDGSGKNCPSGYSSVTFGESNHATGDFSVVAGGFLHTASGKWSFIGGGYWNKASARWSDVHGGAFNIASGDHAAVYGGRHNTASKTYSVVMGGTGGTSPSNYSYAFGENPRSLLTAQSSIHTGEPDVSEENVSISVGQ